MSTTVSGDWDCITKCRGESDNGGIDPRLPTASAYLESILDVIQRTSCVKFRKVPHTLLKVGDNLVAANVKPWILLACDCKRNDRIALYSLLLILLNWQKPIQQASQ